MDIKRGDIYYADLSPVVGAEEGGIRPVLVISDENNKGTVIIAAITSKSIRSEDSAIVSIHNGGLFPETVLLNHLRTIDKRRLKEFRCSLEPELMQKINKALCMSLGL